jgi:hypothetical protein
MTIEQAQGRSAEPYPADARPTDASTPTPAVNTSIRFRMFAPLENGHDYLETLKGATYRPVELLIKGLWSIAMAFREMALGLAIMFRIKSDDGNSHFSGVLWGLWFGFTLINASIISLISSIIELVTRPIVTLFTGFKPEEPAASLSPALP